jgi:hypothetical protein
MATPVWTFMSDYVHKVKRQREIQVIPMGGGGLYDISVDRSIATTRADGTGSVTSYSGANVFFVKVRFANYDGDEKAKDILDFLQARNDANEAFYFYSPIEESDSSLWNGTNTTGRYLVFFRDDLEWAYADRKVAGFNLTFHEVAA